MRIMKLAMGVLLVALLAGCAIHYRSGSSCYSFEMISTGDEWCKRVRMEHDAREKADAALIEQFRILQQNEDKP